MGAKRPRLYSEPAVCTFHYGAYSANERVLLRLAVHENQRSKGILGQDIHRSRLETKGSRSNNYKNRRFLNV